MQINREPQSSLQFIHKLTYLHIHKHFCLLSSSLSLIGPPIGWPIWVFSSLSLIGPPVDWPIRVLSSVSDWPLCWSALRILKEQWIRAKYERQEFMDPMKRQTYQEGELGARWPTDVPFICDLVTARGISPREGSGSHR